MIKPISSLNQNGSKINAIKQNTTYSFPDSTQSTPINFTGNPFKLIKCENKLGDRIRRLADEASEAFGRVVRKFKKDDELPIKVKSKVLPVYTDSIRSKCMSWNSAHPSYAVTVPSPGCSVSDAEAASRELQRAMAKFADEVDVDPSFSGHTHDGLGDNISDTDSLDAISMKADFANATNNKLVNSTQTLLDAKANSTDAVLDAKTSLIDQLGDHVAFSSFMSKSGGATDAIEMKSALLDTLMAKGDAINSMADIKAATADLLDVKTSAFDAFDTFYNAKLTALDVIASKGDVFSAVSDIKALIIDFVEWVSGAAEAL